MDDKQEEDVTALAAASTSNYVYIRSKEYGWIPGRVLETEVEGEEEGVVKVSVPQYRSEASIQSDGGKHAIHFETCLVDLKEYPNHTLLLQNVDEEGQLKQVEDMVDLPFLHEAAILYNLKARHMQGKPYTRTGDIVIACNPYQWIHSIYTTATRRHYANALVWKASGNDNNNNNNNNNNNMRLLEPHIYEVSAAAYRGLAIDGMDQAVLVSGESGAGKTESVKICLHHIASVQEGTAGQEDVSDENSSTTNNNNTTVSSTSPIVQRVLDSNPLLEAFGNAQTVRNDNSSRFGKYIQLQFDVEDVVDAVYAGHAMPSCVLAGSKCDVYLLEKSRVVQHEPEERTYHVFYQLLATDNPTKQLIWGGLVDTDQESFSYVGYTPLDTIEGSTDKQRFQKTLDSLALIGVTGEKMITLFRAICIVLQLGNLLVEPDPDDEDNRSVITSTDELDELADLMGVDAQLLTSAFIIRTMRARNEEFKVPLNATQARDSCDAFAKEIYARAFLWLVRCINDATCAELNYAANSARKRSSFGTIGLLDIFGFESFETNRFEQMCINYANEKLQQKFTQDIFRSVQNEYQAEGIELGEIKYDDNTDVLDLVEGRMGLLAVLNEECVRPGGNDKAFVMKILDHHKHSPCLYKGRRYTIYQFAVQHYAGQVVYHAEGFVQKNMDTLPTDLQECAKLSSNDILAHHMNNDSMMNTTGPADDTPKKKPPRKSTTPAAAAAGAAKTNPKQLQKKGSALVGQTVWTKFKSQLTALMLNLGRTRTRYIRCIKPNTMKQPLLMQHNTTVEQLRCAGVVAAVTISRSAFPNRLEHEVCLERFKALWTSKKHQVEARDIAKETTTNPTEQSKIMADQLLSTAMAGLETLDPQGVKVKAFVMGHTRTYFRAGALEFLEAERLKRLGFWAADIQRIVRGFCKVRMYRRIRRMAVRIQAKVRQHQATHTYRTQRQAAIRIECWHRLVSAKRLLLRLRNFRNATAIQNEWRRKVARARYVEQRMASIVVQAMVRGALQRPKYRVALQQHKEDAKLENQVLALQRKLEEAEKRRVEAERLAEERAQKAVREYEEKREIEFRRQEQERQQQQQQQLQQQQLQQQQQQLQQQETKKAEEEKKPQQQQQPAEEVPKTAADAAATGAAKASLAEPDTPSRVALQQQLHQQQLLQQQTLIDESGKMLEYLRKEVFKLRGQNTQLRRDTELLKDNNKRLMDANASAGASFAALNNHAKQVTKANEKLMAEISQIRQQSQRTVVTNTELKEELKMKHATYVAEVHSRIQYQKAMNKIVEMVERRCRDTRLVEDVLMVADECESNNGLDGPAVAAVGVGQTAYTTPAPRRTRTTTADDGPESSLMSSIRSFWS